jgi:hypothetical protein
MTRALLVYPEFRSASFWNYTETCQLLDDRYPAAPLGLCTVAAMLPATGRSGCSIATSTPGTTACSTGPTWC